MMTFITTSRGLVTEPHSEPTDSELVQRAAEGDDSAFELLFTRHVRAVRGFLAARIGSEAAEDLVAETFAAAWTATPRFDAEFKSARPWLYGIATKLLRRHAELEARWQRSLIAAAESSSATSTLPPHDRGTDPLIEAAVARLDPREREVLMLVALAELKVSEAAAVLGISPVAARLRLYRARRRIINHLAWRSSTDE
jgi:RNA polymerase sigma factor (sigma-70 family)